MPRVIKAALADDVCSSSEAWQWPIDLAKYDRSLTLAKQEREALSEIVHRSRFPLTVSPPLKRLLQPMCDALAMSTSVRMRCHAKKVLLIEMHQRQKPFWAWSREEWAEILGATWQSFTQRYPKLPLCRQQVLLVGYLLCGFTDFHLLGGFTRESLAQIVFGRERVEATMERVNEGVRLWGLVNLRDMSLRGAVYEALLLNRNPSLEKLTYDLLLMMRERTETLALKRALGKLSCALFQLGMFTRTLPHVPLPAEKRAEPVKHLLDGTPTVASPWLERVQEGCSSGSTPLGVLSGGFSGPSQSSDHETNHGELHHTFAAAG